MSSRPLQSKFSSFSNSIDCESEKEKEKEKERFHKGDRREGLAKRKSGKKRLSDNSFAWFKIESGNPRSKEDA